MRGRLGEPELRRPCRRGTPVVTNAQRLSGFRSPAPSARGRAPTRIDQILGDALETKRRPESRVVSAFRRRILKRLRGAAASSRLADGHGRGRADHLLVHDQIGNRERETGYCGRALLAALDPARIVGRRVRARGSCAPRGAHAPSRPAARRVRDRARPSRTPTQSWRSSRDGSHSSR
jgi:hypothetical protein